MRDMHPIQLPEEFSGNGFVAWRAGNSDVAFIAYIGVPILRIEANCEHEWMLRANGRFDFEELAWGILEGDDGEGHVFMRLIEAVNAEIS